MRAEHLFRLFRYTYTRGGTERSVPMVFRCSGVPGKGEKASQPAPSKPVAYIGIAGAGTQRTPHAQRQPVRCSQTLPARSGARPFTLTRPTASGRIDPGYPLRGGR